MMIEFEVPLHRTYFPGYAIEVYCSCRMPETYDDMVECDTGGDCTTWSVLDSSLSLKRMKSGTVLNVKSDSSNFFKLVVSHIVASPHAS